MPRQGWLLGGVLAGLAAGLGQVAYLSGAAHGLASAAESLVGDGGSSLLLRVTSGASARVIEGLTAAMAVALPGATALLAVLAAKGALRVRAVVSVALVALAALGYAYQGVGAASGGLLLAVTVAGLAVAASGPLVIAPLGVLAGLLCSQTLPRLLTTGPGSLSSSTAPMLHHALTGTTGAPTWARIVLVVIAAVPFAVAGRAIIHR